MSKLHVMIHSDLSPVTGLRRYGLYRWWLVHKCWVPMEMRYDAAGLQQAIDQARKKGALLHNGTPDKPLSSCQPSNNWMLTTNPLTA